MKIPSNEIKTKEIAGKTKQGDPVVYIETIGGLHAFFAKNKDGKIEAIGASPHKAISQFLSEKKYDIEWNEDFSKPEESNSKTEKETFKRLRDFLFADVSLQKSEASNIYVVYEVNKKQISFMKKEDIIKGLDDKTLDKHSLARDLNCTIKATCLYAIKHFNKDKKVTNE